MLVLTGKGEKTLRDGNFPKNTVIFPDLAFAVSALLGGRVSRRRVRAALARCSCCSSSSSRPFYAVDGPAVCSGCRACRATGSHAAGASVNLCAARAGSAASASASIGAREHPRRRRTVIVAKHSSTWETLALNLYFPPLAFVAKKELLSIPFFGWGFALVVADHDRPQGRARMRCSRSSSRVASAFAQGFWIVIYPEGTRIRAGTRAKLQDRRRAARAGAAPCRSCRSRTTPVIFGRRDVLGKRPGTMTMSIGKPIATGRQGPCRR